MEITGEKMAAAKVVGPQDGKSGSLGGIGVRFMIDGADAGERFSLVEHPMPPRALAAPLDRHTREDEYSFVIEGRMGALLGDEVLTAQPGDMVFKPREQWHTFWNAGDEPARILEIISPAGFEHFFDELVDLRGVAHESSGSGERAHEVEPEVFAALCEPTGLKCSRRACPGSSSASGCAWTDGSGRGADEASASSPSLLQLGPPGGARVSCWELSRSAAPARRR
jgi:mannose-6-phosphate isomerase-like protein (cupin superfamily)